MSRSCAERIVSQAVEPTISQDTSSFPTEPSPYFTEGETEAPFRLNPPNTLSSGDYGTIPKLTQLDCATTPKPLALPVTQCGNNDPSKAVCENIPLISHSSPSSSTSSLISVTPPLNLSSLTSPLKYSSQSSTSSMLSTVVQGEVCYFLNEEQHEIRESELRHVPNKFLQDAKETLGRSVSVPEGLDSKFQSATEILQEEMETVFIPQVAKREDSTYNESRSSWYSEFHNSRKLQRHHDGVNHLQKESNVKIDATDIVPEENHKRRPEFFKMRKSTEKVRSVTVSGRANSELDLRCNEEEEELLFHTNKVHHIVPVRNRFRHRLRVMSQKIQDWRAYRKRRNSARDVEQQSKSQFKNVEPTSNTAVKHSMQRTLTEDSTAIQAFDSNPHELEAGVTTSRGTEHQFQESSGRDDDRQIAVQPKLARHRLMEVIHKVRSFKKSKRQTNSKSKECKSSDVLVLRDSEEVQEGNNATDPKGETELLRVEMSPPTGHALDVHDHLQESSRAESSFVETVPLLAVEEKADGKRAKKNVIIEIRASTRGRTVTRILTKCWILSTTMVVCGLFVAVVPQIFEAHYLNHMKHSIVGIGSLTAIFGIGILAYKYCPLWKGSRSDFEVSYHRVLQDEG